MFVDFVGDCEEIVFDTEVCDLGEFFAGVDFAGGVVGGVDEDRFGFARVDLVLEFVEVE